MTLSVKSIDAVPGTSPVIGQALHFDEPLKTFAVYYGYSAGYTGNPGLFLEGSVDGVHWAPLLTITGPTYGFGDAQGQLVVAHVIDIPSLWLRANLWGPATTSDGTFSAHIIAFDD